MNKKKVILLYGAIGMITIIFITIGLIFKKTDLEKLNGLTDIYDISSEGDIAYVSYDKGKSGIYLKSKNGDGLLTEYNEEKIIEDISFIQDENLLVYSLIDRELDSDNVSSIHVLDITNGANRKLHESNGIITEVVADPKDVGIVYLLKATSYENYSPIARMAPHNFDLYQYDLGMNQETRLTYWDKYSMQSLNISATEEFAYVQMVDDEAADSAEDIFDAKQKIFQIPLDNPSDFTIISNENREADIYDFAFLQDKSGIIFQSASNYAAGNTFKYELYFQDLESKEEIQLTELEEYTGRPIFSKNDEKIYFIVDKAFAKKHPDYYLYKMDKDGKNIEEIQLKYR